MKADYSHYFLITANTQPRQLKEERVSFGSQLQGKSIMAGKSWGPKLEAAGPMAPRTKPGEQCRPSISKGDLTKTEACLEGDSKSCQVDNVSCQVGCQVLSLHLPWITIALGPGSYVPHALMSHKHGKTKETCFCR